MHKPPRTVLATLLLCLLSAHGALADLIVDPTFGTALLTPAEFTAHGSFIDDEVYQSNQGLPFTNGTFKFFGNALPLSNLHISTNGNLNDGSQASQDDFFPKSFATGEIPLRIAPLWDDLYFGDPVQFPNVPANQIYETTTANYYAVTWVNARLQLEVVGNAFPATFLSTQVILFTADTRLRGFDFKANDIAFGYISKTATTGDFGLLTAEVGLNASLGTYARLTQLANNQLVKNQEADQLLPWQTNQALLYRPVLDGNNNFLSYNVSRISLTAVPEPTFLMSCLAIGAIALRRRLSHTAL